VSPLGRWCAIGAVVLAALTVVTWNRDGDQAVADAPAADGRQLFQARGCAVCHGNPAADVPNDGGFPSLHAAAVWAGERRPGLTADAYLAESMRTPEAFISPAWKGGGPTTAMPQLNLTDAEIDALVDYLIATGA
jgi:mono/diheme cytochrome c family protein